VLLLGLAGWGAAQAPSRAFELPDLGTLLGTEDPLKLFPDSLPANGTFRLRYEDRDIYRYRKGAELQDYNLANLGALGLVHAGAGWVGARWGTDRMQLLQRDVHRGPDRFKGDREVRHVALALAAGGRSRGFHLLLGASDGLEIAAEAAVRRTGRLESVEARGWLWRSRLDLSQAFDETTFFFPFRYRDETGELSVTVRPARACRLVTRLRRQVVVGEKTDPDRYNLLYVGRWVGEGRIELGNGRGLDLLVHVDRSDFGLAMALDGIRYAQVDDLLVTRRLAELGWSVARPWRVAVGYDRWDLDSDAPSWFDVWPFTVWDVFTATRYRLESLSHSWDMAYARITWTPLSRGPLLLGLDGRLEWWGDNGELFWKKRVPTFPPFFFRFDHEANSLDWSFTHGAQIDSWIRWSAGTQWHVRLDGQLVVPWGQGGGAGGDDGAGDDGGNGVEPGPDETAASQRGGLRIRLSAGVDW